MVPAENLYLTSRSLNRSLAVRLGLATVVLSLLIGVLACLTLRSRFIEFIDAVTRVAAVRVNARLLPLLDAPGSLDHDALQAELDRMSTGRSPHLEQGRFVLMDLIEPGMGRVAAFRDGGCPQMPAIEAALAARPLPGPGARTELFHAAGLRLVLVSHPLTDSLERPILTAMAVFAVSPQTLADYRWQMLRTVMTAAGLILATALVLYPLLRMLLNRVIGLSRRLMLANLDTIRTLGSAIAKRDSDTDDHNYRVALYCVAFAEALGLPKASVPGLIKGAFLHDVGKIGIHDRILLKPGRLDEEEFAEMKKHVDYGMDIVKSCHWLSDATEVVGCHHEKFDGSGYPAGLRGEAIPLNARIFAVVDVFDALISRRPYKEPLPLDTCLEILAGGRGSHFDPVLVDVFIGLAAYVYFRYGQCSAAGLREAMRSAIGRYFESTDAIP